MYCIELINHTKKDGDYTFTTIPCEPSTGQQPRRKPNIFVLFWEIHPCTNSTMYGRLGVVRTLLCVFVST